MTDSLYERLGGGKGIHRIVEDAIAAHLANPIVKTRFEAIKDIERAKKLAREFFCMGSGGPEQYTGREMPAAHKGMNISEQEYLAVCDDIVGTLDKHKMSDETKKDVIAILYSLKDHIIRK